MTCIKTFNWTTPGYTFYLLFEEYYNLDVNCEENVNESEDSQENQSTFTGKPDNFLNKTTISLLVENFC